MRHSTTEQRHDLRQLATCVLCALALASLPGCGEQSPTEPEAAAPQVAQPDELAADFTADQSAATPAAAGPVGATATRLPRSFFVNPITGKRHQRRHQAAALQDPGPGPQHRYRGRHDATRRRVSTARPPTARSSPIQYPAGRGPGRGDGLRHARWGASPLSSTAVRAIYSASTSRVAATVRNLVVTGFPTGSPSDAGSAVTEEPDAATRTRFGLNLDGSAKATLVGGSCSRNCSSQSDRESYRRPCRAAGTVHHGRRDNQRRLPPATSQRRRWRSAMQPG